MAKTKEVREGTREGLRKNRTPRVLFAIEDAAPKPKSTTKRSTVPKTKANTSKPRAKAATAGRVEKKKAPATKNKRTPTVIDKVKGIVEKAVGTIEGKPAKKVCCGHPSSLSKSCRVTMMTHVFRAVHGRWLILRSRLPARRRSRALTERDLLARRKLRLRFGILGLGFIVRRKHDRKSLGSICAIHPPLSCMHAYPSLSLSLSLCVSLSFTLYASEARRKM